MSLFKNLFGKRDGAIRLTVEEQQSDYLHSSRWDELLQLRPDGMPPVRLRRHGYEWHLVEERTGKVVSVGNRKLRPLGLWTVRVRGLEHHKAEAKAAELSAGAPLSLTREPDNPFDSWAIAVSGANTKGTIGYVNKQMAAGLAKILDSGTEIEAISQCGSQAGSRQQGNVKLVAATPEIMRWIRRHR